MDENKIDIFNPAVVMAFVAAFIGDFTFFLVITHYVCGAIVLGAFFTKSKGIPAKFVLATAFILPGPFLTISIILAIMLSNKVLAFLAQQAAIQLIALGTGGAGEALEAGALAETGAAAGEAAIEAGVAATEVGTATAGGAIVTAEGAEVAVGATETEEVAQGAVEVGTSAEETEGLNKGKSGLERARDIEEKIRGGSHREEDEEENPQEEFAPEITGEERALLGEKGGLNKELFGPQVQIPTGAREEEEVVPNKAASNEELQKNKVQDIRKRQEKLKPIFQVPVEEKQDQEDEGLKKAA